MNKKVQISESIELGILLALSGGFMDAYSYIGRGEVFANAQTGNMLLLGVHLSEGNIPAAIRYLCPVLAFTFGIALADIVRNSGIGSHLHFELVLFRVVCTGLKHLMPRKVKKGTPGLNSGSSLV